MQYDISTVDESADILSAVLRVYKHSNHVSYTFAAAYTVHEITEAWDPSAIGWSDGWSTEGGTFDPQALDTFEYDGTYNGWFEFDVTETIKKKLQDENNSYGFMLHVPGDPETGVSKNNQESYFHATESSDFEHKPHIVVTLDGTSLTDQIGLKANLHQEVLVRNGTLNIAVEDKTEVLMYTLKGQLLQSVKLSQGSHSLPLHQLAQGCLLVKQVNSKGSRSSIVPIR